jgi:plastocyanin
MSKKKKRRGAQAKNLDQSAPSAEGAGDAPPDEAERSQRRAQQVREWEQRKKQRERANRSLAPVYWGAAVAGVIALAAVGGLLLLSGGGDEAASAPSATPDARVAGLPIDQTITVNMDDDGQATNPRYEPNTISGVAGEVIEIVAVNVGSVAHNLRVAGIDGEYDTRDDWITDPATVFAGEEGRVVVKLDEPGIYPFKCDFHPQQTGTLTLR